MRHLFIIIGIFSCFFSTAQVKSIGLPLIQNFEKKDYNGDTQNWSMVQDERGLIYVGNNQGILKFDGFEWKLFPVKNNSIVRSLALGNDGNIYVGAYNEFGRLVEGSNGEKYYESFVSRIPEEYRNFDDVWKVYQTRYGVIFQSFEYLFIYNEGLIKVIQPSTRFGYSYYLNNNYYVVDKSRGLQVYDSGSLKTISRSDVFMRNEVRFIMPFKSNALLVGTLSEGFYILKNDKIEKWQTEANELMLENKIFSGLKIEEVYVIGSIKNGIFFFDEAGNLLQHINRQRGLQNNTVLSIFQDNSNNIWLGLDNGIDLIKSSLPISILDYNYNLEAVYASVVYDGMLYVGTNQGLFAKPLSRLSDVEDIAFEMLPNTDGQIWDLTIIDGQLFCGHTNGAFIIEGMNARSLYSGLGVWNFLQPTNDESVILSGTYDGIVSFRKNAQNKWVYSNKIEGIDISVRDLIEDVSGNLWMDHGYKGIYKIAINASFSEATEFNLYNAESRLPKELPYIVHKIEDQLFFSTHDGIYQYNYVRDNFLRPQNLNAFYKNLEIIYHLKQDYKGNIWYFSESDLGVFKLLEDGSYALIEAPFTQLRNSLMASFSNIYVYDSENIFIGTKDGLVHYNPEILKDYRYEISPIIKQVYISDQKSDSLWLPEGSAQNISPEENLDDFAIPFQFNTIQFWYSSNDFENTETAEFRFRLVGFSDTWSEWAQSHNKEYTNLRENNYRFELQTRNIYGNVSEVETFYFELKPPFYRSLVAYIVYFVFAMTLITLIVNKVVRRIDKVRKQEKAKQEEKYKEKTQKLKEENLLVEKELVRLRNDKLKSNVKYKNKELANATYHIIQKNKILNKLKSDLSALSQKAKSEWVEKELKKISRNIDRDINHEQNWMVFNKYFDEVHQDFLNELKKKHPELTPKDLRLCAYLRMNISTKEIAPLFNISVRGVEISRYRLRKKLNLEHDENLTEYLLNF